MEIKIRRCTLDDANRLVEIYAPYVENTSISFEYSIPTVAEFQNRINNILPHYPFLVAEVEGRVVGYCYANEFKHRCAYSHCVENSIYVAQDFQGQGIGRMLYDELESQLAEMGKKNLYACIAWIDKPDEHLTHQSVLFHERMGFSRIAHFHRCGWKFNKWYDTLWMEKLI